MLEIELRRQKHRKTQSQLAHLPRCGDPQFEDLGNAIWGTVSETLNFLLSSKVVIISLKIGKS